MCKVKGCKTKPVAKGLCAKHYMRQRRTGDPMQTGRAGRKPSPTLALYRSVFHSDWGARTIARYAWAMTMLPSNSKESIAAIKAATRPNGTVNVSRLSDIAAMTHAHATSVTRRRPRRRKAR